MEMLWKKFSMVLALLTCIMSMYASTQTFSNNESGVNAAPEPKRYIVEFTHPSRADIKKRSTYRYSITRSSLENAETIYQNERAAVQALLQSSAQRSFNAPTVSSNTPFDFKTVINAVTLTLTEAQKAKLAKLPVIKAIYEDQEMSAFLTQSVPIINADKVWSENQLQGEGMVVAVIDSGIDYTHPDLGGGFGPGYKVIGGYDFFNNDADPMDDNNHGTHCAGIIAADGLVKGVAPKAKLMAYKVLSSMGTGSMATIIAGIERACDPDSDPATDDKVDVISMSLGYDNGNPDDAVSRAVDNAFSLGVVVVVAGGNSGSDENTIGSPGCAKSAITVANTVKNFPIVNPSSSVGPTVFFNLKPDVSAPGTLIYSTIRGGGYAEFTGTSMACPHIAGVAALVKQGNPAWSPDMVKSAIMNTATDLQESALKQGTGLVEAKRAVNTELLISPASLSLGVVDNPVPGNAPMSGIVQKNVSFTLTHSGTAMKSMSVSCITSPSTTAIFAGYATSITIPPQGTSYFPVDITIDQNALDAGNYTLMFVMTDETTNETYRIPVFFSKKPLDVTTTKPGYTNTETVYIRVNSMMPLTDMNFTLTSTAVPDITIDNYRVLAEGGPGYRPWIYDLTTDLTHDGEYQITVASTDSLGNLNHGIQTIHIDTIAPTITMETESSRGIVSVYVNADEDISNSFYLEDEVLNQPLRWVENQSIIVEESGKAHMTMLNKDTYRNQYRRVIYQHSNNNGDAWTDPMIISDDWNRDPAMGIDSDNMVHITYYKKNATSNIYELTYVKVDPSLNQIISGPHTFSQVTVSANGTAKRARVLFDSQNNMHVVGANYIRIDLGTNLIEEVNETISSFIEPNGREEYQQNVFIDANDAIHIMKRRSIGGYQGNDFIHAVYNYQTASYQENIVLFNDANPLDVFIGLAASRAGDGNIYVLGLLRSAQDASQLNIFRKRFDGTNWVDGGTSDVLDTNYTPEQFQTAVSGDRIYLFTQKLSSKKVSYKVLSFDWRRNAFDAPLYTHEKNTSDVLTGHVFRAAPDGSFYLFYSVYYNSRYPLLKLHMVDYTPSPQVVITSPIGTKQYVAMQNFVDNRWLGHYYPSVLGTHTATVNAWDVTRNQSTITPQIEVTEIIPTPTPVYPAWDAQTVYYKDDIVTHNGKVWRAKWWTQGNEPGGNTGGIPWEEIL